MRIPKFLFTILLLTLSLVPLVNLSCDTCSSCSSATKLYEPRLYLVSASQDKSTILWDYQTQTPLIKHIFPKDMKFASFNSIGNVVTTGCADGYARIWDPFTNTIIFEFLDTADLSVSNVKISKDQTRMAVLIPPKNKLLLFDYKTKALLNTWEIGSFIDNPFLYTDFDNDNNLIGSRMNFDFKIYSTKPSYNTILSVNIGSRISTTHFSPDGTKLALGMPNSPYKLLIYDYNSGQLCDPPDVAKNYLNSFYFTAWSPDSKRIVTGQYYVSGGRYTAKSYLWNTQGDLIKDLLDSQIWDLISFLYLPNGTRILAVLNLNDIIVFDENGNLLICESFSLNGPNGHTVNSVWRISVFPSFGCNQYTVNCPICSVCCDRSSPVVKEFITVSDDGNIIIWDLEKNSKITHTGQHINNIRAMAVSPDLKKFASAAVESDFYLKLFELDTGCLIWEIPHAHVGSINHLAFSADGDWLATSSSDKTIKVWNVNTRCLTEVFFENTGPIISSRFFRTGLSLISFSEDSFLKIWDLTTGSLASSLEVTSLITSGDLSSDDSLAAIATCAKTISIFKTECALLEEIVTFSTTSIVTSIKFTTDNSLIVAGNIDGTIEIWRTNDGTLVQTFVEKHSSQVTDLKYFENILASVSVDTDLKIWDFKRKILLNTFSGHTGPINTVDFVSYNCKANCNTPNCLTCSEDTLKCFQCIPNYYLFKEVNQDYFSTCVSKDNMAGFYVEKGYDSIDGFGRVVRCHPKCGTCKSARKCTSCPALKI